MYIFPPTASHFNFKPGIIKLLPTFHGLDLENPYLHWRAFEEVCSTYNDLNCSMNTIILKRFPFSLKDKAKTWLQNLRSGFIRAWDEMQQQFLKKFFPSHRTNSFKRQIITFTQKPGETFYQCWDRNFSLLIEQTLSKDKSPLSLKNLEKHFTSFGIDIRTCLIPVLIMVLKHEDWFHIFIKG